MIWRVCKLLAVVLVVSLLVSCAPTKQAAYFRYYNQIENKNSPDRVYYINEDYPEHIQPGDLLYINVTTADNQPNSFNQQGGRGVTDVELQSYVVDSEGCIRLPYLNRLKLSDFTLNQAVDTIELKLSQYTVEPSVTVHFSTSRISILGEVNSPGVYEFNRKSVNIYQAIAYANDISIFGNRKKVTIMRQDGNSIVKKQVDLTNDDIVTSEWYRIQGNDIIYVEPLGRKIFGMETFDYGLVFSVISTMTLLYTFYNTQH